MGYFDTNWAFDYMEEHAWSLLLSANTRTDNDEGKTLSQVPNESFWNLVRNDLAKYYWSH